MSVAVYVGFIALAGVAAETGVVMLIFLEEAVARYRREGRLNTRRDLEAAIFEGAVLRVRRITSYNVCYTKLLRFFCCFHPGRAAPTSCLPRRAIDRRRGARRLRARSLPRSLRANPRRTLV